MIKIHFVKFALWLDFLFMLLTVDVNNLQDVFNKFYFIITHKEKLTFYTRGKTSSKHLTLNPTYIIEDPTYCH